MDESWRETTEIHLQQQHNRSISGSPHIMNSIFGHFNNPEMSDLVIKLGDDRFFAHKFVLGLMSDVFRTMCSRRWDGDRNPMVLEVRECEECVPVFESFLKFLYCGDIEINVDSALPLLMLADKYNVQPLKEKFESFMEKTVKDGSVSGALRWLSYAQVSEHNALQYACIDVIVAKMDDVVAADEFQHLEYTFLVSVLGRDDLVVLWEIALYDAVRQWIETRLGIEKEEVKMLLSLIRFPMMLPEQLYQIETSAFYIVNEDILFPMLASAHRFRSIASEVFDAVAFSEATFRPRNYTHRLWCYYLTAEMNSEAFYQNSVGVRCINHPVLSSPEQYWQIRVLGEKRSVGGSSSNKPTLLPHLGYVFAPTSPPSGKSVPLVITVTPLRPIKQDIVVDVALFQVKKDKLSKFLCQSTMKFSPEEYFSAMEVVGSSPNRKCSTSGSPLLMSQPQQPVFQNAGTLKFSPTPMNFAVMFQKTHSTERHEVTLRYNFSPKDFDHPPEVPCFKFNGLPRMTNSVRVAVIFKPRFETCITLDGISTLGTYGPKPEHDSGLAGSSDEARNDSTLSESPES